MCYPCNQFQFRMCCIVHSKCKRHPGQCDVHWGKCVQLLYVIVRRSVPWPSRTVWPPMVILCSTFVRRSFSTVTIPNCVTSIGVKAFKYRGYDESLYVAGAHICFCQPCPGTTAVPTLAPSTTSPTHTPTVTPTLSATLQLSPRSYPSSSTVLVLMLAAIIFVGANHIKSVTLSLPIQTMTKVDRFQVTAVSYWPQCLQQIYYSCIDSNSHFFHPIMVTFSLYYG